MRKTQFTWVLAVVGFIARNWQWIVALASGVAVTVAAVFTDILGPYRPISYVLAFIAGTILVMAVLSLGALIAVRLAKRAFYNHVQRQPFSVNPLDATFTGQRIAVDQLADPETREIYGKTFVGCELIGRRLTFIFSGCQMFVHRSLALVGSDLISMPIKNGASMRLGNAFTFQNCTFRECRFYYMTAIFNDHDAHHFVEDGVLPTQGWIVAPPAPTK